MQHTNRLAEGKQEERKEKKDFEARLLLMPTSTPSNKLCQHKGLPVFQPHLTDKWTGPFCVVF